MLGFPFTVMTKFALVAVGISAVMVSLTTETPTIPEAAPAPSGVIWTFPTVTVTGPETT